MKSFRVTFEINKMLTVDFRFKNSRQNKFNNFKFHFSIPEFQEAFNLFDNRGDGKIQQQQIGECLRALGQNPTESDVKKFTHQLKPDDRISFEVFLPIYQVT